MKNAYPQPNISSPLQSLTTAIFFLLIGAAILTFILRFFNFVNDSRLFWASAICFAGSLALYQRTVNPALRSKPIAFEEEASAEYENDSLSNAYTNSDRPVIEATTFAPVVAPEQTIIYRPAQLEPAKQSPAVDPKLAQQKSTQFMSLAEFQGNVPVEPVAPPLQGRLELDVLAGVTEAHRNWLERGALPDATGRAVLLQVDLSGHDLRGVILARANLTGSILNRANLCEANLSGATLCQSELIGADLRGADLRETDLRECCMEGVDARGADLRGAELLQVQLSGANLAGADASEAYLSGANLIKCDLSGAKLDGAYLSGALLMGTDLTGASLEGIDLRRARYDAETRWPARFEPRQAGALMIDEATQMGMRMAA